MTQPQGCKECGREWHYRPCEGCGEDAATLAADGPVRCRWCREGLPRPAWAVTKKESSTPVDNANP